VHVSLRTPDLVQMEVTGAEAQGCKVDLGVFWRAHDPVLLEIGPMLHPDDAVGGKMDSSSRILANESAHDPGADTAIRGSADAADGPLLMSIWRRVAAFPVLGALQQRGQHRENRASKYSVVGR
jgi:hypothetical protein